MTNAKIYPAVFTPEEKGYTVYVPDLGIGTQGDDLGEAIMMARDAIGITIVDMEDDDETVPAPSQEKIRLEGNQFINYIDIDILEYRKRSDIKAVKKNCTIPYYLAKAADKAAVNYSKLLQEALRQELGMN